MSTRELEIQLILAVAAVACALPGVFLVLRRLALMSDAISHAILLGIVLAFFATHNLSSPLLVVGAAATGVLTVILVELLNRTRLVREDAAIGLVYPALFSMGVILISGFLRKVHLDINCVLLGKPEFAPFRRLIVHDLDLGPQALYVMGATLLLNLLFIVVFYKELKLATFDAALSAALGFSPALIHYSLMTLVSVTAVGAFEAVGSILVVSLMIAPPATAFLLTDRLARLLGLSAAIGVAGALGGFWVAQALDASIAGSMATVNGLLFGLAFVLAPQRGLIALAWRRSQQRWEFAQTMLAIHLYNHEGLPEAERESRLEHLEEHLRWKPTHAAQVVRRAERGGILLCQDGRLNLTPEGRDLARRTLAY